MDTFHAVGVSKGSILALWKSKRNIDDLSKSLKLTRWFRELCRSHKILNEKYPSYLFDLTPNLSRVYETRHSNDISAIHVRHNYFRTSFFLQLYLSATNLIGKLETQSVSIFKKKQNFTRPCAASVFDIHNSYGIKLLTILRLCLSHLHNHKFRHRFQDILNTFCDCGDDTKTIAHFFLHYPSFRTPRKHLLNNFRNIK